MKPRLTRRARQDIEEIGAYIRERNPAAAIKVRDEITEALHMIGDHPQIGRDLGGQLRRLPLPRSSHLELFRVTWLRLFVMPGGAGYPRLSGIAKLYAKVVDTRAKARA